MHEFFAGLFWASIAGAAVFAVCFVADDGRGDGVFAWLIVMALVAAILCFIVAQSTPATAPRPDAIYCNRNNECVLLTPTPTLMPTPTEPR